MTDLIVIGGGASGIAAASAAAERHLSVILLEKSDRIGRKILASGNGRCNLMNSGDPVYHGDTEFALKVLKNCPRSLLTGFLQHYGLRLTEEEEGRIYPVTFRSSSVLAVLKNMLNVTGVRILTKTAAASISRHHQIWNVVSDQGDFFKARNIIVTCGGPAQPSAGGTSDGLELLRSVGHTIIPVMPALVPLVTDPKGVSGLSGIRVRCGISVILNHEILHHENGEVLFTDYGISGICVMQCSRYAYGSGTQLEIDFLHRIFKDRHEAFAELLRRRELYADHSPVCLFDGLLPEKVSYAVLKQAGIRMRGESAGDLSDEDLRKTADTAFRYRLKVLGTRGMDFAQVTAGGADCAEFDPDTMSSRICPGLYAAGEVLNVDGGCGGFNLMFAFASGMLAGRAV